MPGENVASVNFSSLWNAKVHKEFNYVAVGKVFRFSQTGIVVGFQDGVVGVYDIPKTAEIAGEPTPIASLLMLESKGGPIQMCALHDVTRLNGNDVIVGDSRGTVTLFCNEQILTRKAVSEHCIHCLQIQQDALGSVAIITGDNRGRVSAFTPYEDLWRVRLPDCQPTQGLKQTLRVESLLSVNLNSAHGQQCPYILAADNSRRLYFLQQGHLVLTLHTPAVVTAMCAGKFADAKAIETSSPAEQSNGDSPYDTQVALATDTGAIYIMTNFEVYTDDYVNIKLPITQLKCLPATDGQDTDTLLCAGNFNAISFIRDGKEIARQSTRSWVNSLIITDTNGSGVPDVVVGCHDNTIQAYSMTLT